mmetsp:Transcript_11879/g.17001  ORF Transcript_11879/g.17001 Transcript_11879/m.17001 type:complete len:231 (+) Transcript_11879:3464-4156(+)
MTTPGMLRSPLSSLSTSSLTLPSIDPSSSSEGRIVVDGTNEGTEDGSGLTEGAREGFPLGAALMDGPPLGANEGVALKLGERDGLSSMKMLFVLSVVETSTDIELGSPPSESETSIKPVGFLSITEYKPGGTTPKTNSPLAFVKVVPTKLALESNSSMTTSGIGESPVSSLSVSSRTLPTIRRGRSSTKSFPVEFNGLTVPIVMEILFKSPPSTSLTSKGTTSRFVSSTL